jgi:hypothetical protein
MWNLKMKTFRDFICAHPAAKGCSGCGQPIGWPRLTNLRFLEMLRERVDDLEITELHELLELAGETTALWDCPLIWDRFNIWRRRQEEKMQQLGTAYGLSTAQ